MKAARQKDEAARIAALHRYEILDTAREQVFDDLTLLAAHVCEVPTAFISFVDAHRQWVKSAVGMTWTETAPDGLCAQAIQQRGLFVVSDIATDARFATARIVADGPNTNIRFYAGAPLITPAGYAVGVLCVMDSVPRQLRAHQEEALHVLSRQVITQLELRRTIAERERAEAALRGSEARLRTTFEHLDDVLFRTDLDGVIQMITPSVERYGYRAAELIGKRDTDVYRDPSSRARIVEQLMKRGALRDIEATMVTKEGIPVPVSSTVHLVRDDQGRPIGMEGVLRDITKRKQAEEALRKAHDELDARVRERTAEAEAARRNLTMVFERITDAFVALDSNWRYTHVNPKAAQIVGRRAEDLIGANIWATFPEALGQPFQRAYRRAMAEQVPIQLEVQWVPHGHWFEHRIYPSPDGLSIFFRDVTERKKADQERERLQSELRRSETLSAMGALIAGVAHEARNPLFGISATLDAFEARFGPQPDTAPYLAVLRGEVNRLNDLMRDLLEYGKPPSATLVPGSLASVIAEAAAACVPLARESGVQISVRMVDDIPALPMDPGRLPHVFQNLLQNAIQHSARESVVSVETRTIGREGEMWIECAVNDSGCGFRQEDLPRRVFEPFFSRRKAGTGLGLAIVERIVDDHRGTISAANRAEGGAVVTVRLPCGESAMPLA